jgi:hypothetical protein
MAVVLRIQDTRVSVARVVIVLVPKDCHNVGFRTVLVEVLSQSASPCVVELVAEQKDSAATEADLEQSGHDRLDGKNVTANSRERLGPGFCQI